MNLIQQGIDKGLITFDEDGKYITYVHQNKRRNYTRPEEPVQAETFLKLVLIYGYAAERIEQFVSVKIGSDTREADIIVYNNDQKTSAHILVECKKEDVSELEFEQAIKQAFSYAATGTVRAKYFWVTSNIKDAYFEIPDQEPRKYLSIPDVPQFGISTLAKFKYVKGGGVVNGQKLFDLEVVTEDELTRRFKQAHNSLWGGGELNPSEAFDELDKLIFCKIWDERKPRKRGDPYDFQIFSEKTESETNKKLQERIRALYEEGRKKDPEVFKDNIRLSTEKLRTVVGYLESVDLGKTDLDSKGRAFETFMGSFFRGDFGQYFTPRPIVKFIVDTLPITNDSLVLDTSCGSGGFLLHALDKVRRQANDYYAQESIAHYNYWHDFAKDNLFGIEINEQIARTAKMNMIIHDDGHTNVIAADGLLPIEDVRDDEGNVTQRGIYSRTYNRGFAYDRFDFIITNPPFGSSIKQTEQAYMRHYGYALSGVDWLNPKSKETPRDNQSTEILFIEQCHNYLREGGYLAIVLPDGVLTNSSLQYVRDGIEEKYRIVAVVSLPQTAFQATGAGVKSSVLFLKKHAKEETETIQHQRVALQDRLKNERGYLNQLRQIEMAKREHLQTLIGFDNPDGITGNALTQSEAYKAWRTEVNALYNDKMDALKEELSEQYAEQLREMQNDYPIFMAIAEDIGYDATGKPTSLNELEFIGKELTRFIEAIEKGQDSFFP
ncbi:MAG: restriction endonuclease subunit M [Caldilinea sp. CFX5]|nr:restriction endonuclease subunit M [Caldilinea sp. CFX5]